MQGRRILRSSCCTRPKKTKTNQKNPEKHQENPPKMHASQGRHMSSDGGSHSRASTRTTPSNRPPQQEWVNTTPQSGKTSIEKASNKIQSLLDASSIHSYGGVTVSYNKLIQLVEWLRQFSKS